MGEPCGLRSPITCYSPTIYAALARAAGSAIEIEAAADERAIYLLEGEAKSTA